MTLVEELVASLRETLALAEGYWEDQGDREGKERWPELDRAHAVLEKASEGAK